MSSLGQIEMEGSTEVHREKHNTAQEEMSSSSDDDELLKAVGQWANQQQHDEDKKSKHHAPPSSQHPKATEKAIQEKNQKWSLHITQLSYNATDFDIRQAFSKQGCLIDSIRLVYDKNTQGKKFRGVAFCDLSNEESFRKGLELHHTTLLGRRINVRPTRTKADLADIIKQTQKELMAKQSSKSATQSHGSKHKEKQRGDNQRKKTSEQKNQSRSKQGSVTNRRRHDSREEKDTKQGNKDAMHKKRKPPSDTSHAMSKKERNRRAAIIMSKKRKVKK